MSKSTTTTPVVSGAATYAELRSLLVRHGDQRYSAPYLGYQLSSHFQPVVSLTHARVIGHEGLLRAVDAEQQMVAPHQLLHQVENDSNALLNLDRVARLLHKANGTDANEGWLFLNMHPRIFATSRVREQRGFSVSACQEFGINPGHVVIEILEHSMYDELQFAETIQNIRQHGYLVALDDFGAGHSNFDRVWKVAPEIVKLDRVFAIGAESDKRIRRLLPRIVALLHEAGVFVVLEGIETRTQAMIALDANIDFAQGYYFGRPKPEPLEIHSLVETAAELWQNYESEIVEQQRRSDVQLRPYQRALGKAAEMLVAGATLDAACSDFLALAEAESCYLLDAEGRQIGRNVWHPDYRVDSLNARFIPVSNIGGARWARRPYFRRAMENIGVPQSTRPYLSTSSAHICITTSLAFRASNETRVVCGDVVWE